MGGMKMDFIVDEKGRVPFAVLGVFLVIGSAVTSGVVTNLEKEYSESAPMAMKTGTVSSLVQAAEADISRALTYSCLKALKKVGESPVTYSELSNQAALDYADGDGKNGVDNRIVGENGVVDTFDEAVEFNKNWARNMARIHFNNYINATFRMNICQDKGYAINIPDPDKDGCVDNWRDIKFSNISMELRRADELDLLISEDNKEYATYWTASIENFPLEICDLSSGDSWRKIINISCLIPSRLPLLMSLTDTYHDSIDGDGSLMGVATVIGEAYTEIRSLLQYAGKYDWAANIVANTWLQYVTNTALTAIQYYVFNSIDPLTIAYLAININDLISKSSVADADKYITDNLEDALKDKIMNMISLDFEADEWGYKTVGKQNQEEAEGTVENLNPSPLSSRKSQGPIYDVARDILYKSSTIYYYDEISDDIVNPEQFEEFKGYRFKDNGNEYRLTTKDGDPINENDGLHQDVYTKTYHSQMENNVLSEMVKKIKNTYSTSFQTIRDREVTEWYAGSKAGSFVKELEPWSLSSSYNKKLTAGELPDLPYSETWTLEWSREEKWEKTVTWTDAEGNSHSKTYTYTPTHHIKEVVTYTIEANGYPDDVTNVFHHQNIFGIHPHEKTIKDDNLEYLLHKYVNEKFIPDRDDYTSSDSPHTTQESSETDTINKIFWQNNNGKYIDWLLGNEGGVMIALKNVTELIKADNAEYTDVSAYSSGSPPSTLDDIERERTKLLTKFKENEDRYINREFYQQNGIYKSAGAKVIAEMREWFCDEIEQVLETSNKDKIEEQINNELGNHNAGIEYQDYEDTKNKYEGKISQIGTIQFGKKMELKHAGGWEENISLAISTTPDYFGATGEALLGSSYEDKAEEENWHFNVKNICLFGPTGLPLLPPTPVTPWIVTINSWYIHIDGHWAEFKVLDGNDETHSDSLFGHSEQIYVRKEADIYDDICNPFTKIGECKRLNFGYDTMSLGIVPPGKLPIGDLTPVDTSGAPVSEANTVGK